MMKRGGGYSLAFLLLLLFPLIFPHVMADGASVTLEPKVFHEPEPLIRLNYSDPVTLTSADVIAFDQINDEESDPVTYTSFQTGDNKVFFLQLDPLIEGTYYLVLHKEDFDNGQPFADDVVLFEYQPEDSVLNIHFNTSGDLRVLKKTLTVRAPNGSILLPFTPETGFATEKPYDVAFTTTEPAWCKYSNVGGVTDPNFMASFSSGSGTETSKSTTHYLNGQTAAESSLIIWCDDGEDTILTRMIIGYEDDLPGFDVTFEPSTIVDANMMRTTVSVTSEQKVHCTAQAGETTVNLASHDLTANDAGAYQFTSAAEIAFGGRPSAKETRNISVTCTNRAGLPDDEENELTIDLDVTPHLRLISPERYTQEESPEIAVQVVKEGYPVTSGYCAFTDGTPGSFISDDSITYTTTLSKLAEGEHTYTVSCVIADNVEVEDEIIFSVDTMPPPAYTATIPAYVCGDEPLTATINLSEDLDEDPNLAGYKFNISYTTGTKILDTGSSASNELESDYEVETNKTYQWNIWPYDLAGNLGTKLTGTTKAIEEGSILCDEEAPTATLKLTETASAMLANVSCTDSESGCTTTFSYDKLRANQTAGDCAYASPESYGRAISFFDDGGFCYKVTDKNGNSDTGYRKIRFDGVGPPPSLHCANSVKDEGETDVDCGGECAACDEGDECVIGADCDSGYCNEESTCEAVSCDDTLKNGYETDVDCGGSTCPSCVQGERCIANGDCVTGNCDSGYCAPSALEAGCTADSDCGSGERCDGGECVAKSELECQTDFNCAYGEECIENSCEPAGSGGGSSDEGFNLLGLVLMIVGLLTMGGTGYWLYFLHGQLREETTRYEEERPVYQPRPQELTPEQRMALAHQRQEALEAAKRQEAQVDARRAKKRKKRQSLGAAFEEDGEETPEEEPEEESVEEQQRKSGLDEGIDDEFIDVRDLGTKSKKYTDESKPAQEQPRRKKKSEAFTELDKVLEEKDGK